MIECRPALRVATFVLRNSVPSCRPLGTRVFGRSQGSSSSSSTPPPSSSSSSSSSSYSPASSPSDPTMPETAPAPTRHEAGEDVVARAGTGAPGPPQKLINLLRGWPSPRMLPAGQLRAAADRVLSDPAVYVPALQYGPDPGYEPLREELARWLGGRYRYRHKYNECGRTGPRPASSSSPSAAGGAGARGLPIRPDEIAITGGASQSLACLLQTFTDPGYTRAVWAAAPCYFLACPIFEDAGFRGRLRAVPEDEGGVDVAALAEGLKGVEERWEAEDHLYKGSSPHRKLYRHVIYLVATCANPSGKTLSLARREALVRLAREYDALLVSDDVYDFLQWPVNPEAASFSSPSPSSSSHLPSSPLPEPLLPLLSQIDMSLGPSRHDLGAATEKHFGHAVSNGSFSKLVGPGIRTGWIHAAPDFAYGFSQTGSNRSGGAASQFAAAVVHGMLAGGDLERHLDAVVRPALRRRHGLVAAEVKRALGPLGVGIWEGNSTEGAGAGAGSEPRGEKKEPERAVFGGYFVWLTLPAGLDAAAVAERARAEENLIIAPGRLFEVSGDEAAARFPRNIRLCFSWEEEENIVEGVRRLARVLTRMLDGARPRAVGEGNVEAQAGGFK